MSSFLEKLKKGMGVENIPEETEISEEETENNMEPVQAVFQKKEKVKKPKRAKKKEEIIEELPTIEPEEKEEQPAEEKQEEENKKSAVKKEEENWFEDIEGQLAVDVYQTDKEIVIQSAIAGIKPEDLDISVENDMVRIKGERQNIAKEEGKNYFYQECYWGKFSREIILPAEVDSSKTGASMKNGVLTIRIPKIEKEKEKKVVIKS